jgi:hypothetical protein
MLPDGDAFEDELSCALVFYPKRDEYRRALLGALTYFETWLAWEIDDDKRGKDAARAWALANVCTLECWNMACIDELFEVMEEVRSLLANRKDCCDDNVTYSLQDEFETDIVPHDGDPPDNYGETEITDWDDWHEHVCYNAHLYVDNLINMGSQVNGAVNQSSLYLGLIAAGLVLLSFSGIGLPVAYLLASFVVTGLVLSATGATFADTAADLEAAREDIVCALLRGYDLADTVEAALSSGTDWDLFYQFVDYDSATAIIYEGGANEEYLSAETRQDCGCEIEYEMYSPPGQLGDVIDQTHIALELHTAGCHRINNCQFRNLTTMQNVEVTITGMDSLVQPGCGTAEGYRFWDNLSQEIYNSNTKPTFPFAGVASITLLDYTDDDYFLITWDA